MGKMTLRKPTLAAVEDEWSGGQPPPPSSRRGSSSAHNSARHPVGNLSDYETRLDRMTGICAWISKRAEQATAEGSTFPWSKRLSAHRNDAGTRDTGAVTTILPDSPTFPG